MLAQLELAVGFGLVTSAIVCLAAVGLSLQFGITNYVNFAFGEVLALGAYFTLLIRQAVPSFWAAAALAVLATGIAAVGLNRLLLQPFVNRRASTLSMLIVTFALSLILQSAIQGFAGPDFRSFGLAPSHGYSFAGLRFTARQIAVIVIAAVAMVALHLTLTRTWLGKAMRAVSDDRDLARVCGIRSRRITDYTWLITGLFGGAAGIFLALSIDNFSPYFGSEFLFVVFAAVILGGIGRPYGAMAGALLVGLSTEVSAVFINPAYKEAVAFAIGVIVLLFKPNGLFNIRGKA